MKKIVGVMGPGAMHATEEDLKVAEEIGKIVAEAGGVLLCGGMSGVMESSAKGAQEAGGITVALGPMTDKGELNPYIDIPIMTGMHSGRNFLNILSSEVVVFVSVASPGTLSELAYAIQLEKPSLVINGSEKLKAYIGEFEAPQVVFIDSIHEVQARMRELLS